MAELVYGLMWWSEQFGFTDVFIAHVIVSDIK